MSSECERCGEKIRAGQRVVQMAKGRYCADQITPTYGDFVTDPDVREWHEDCFTEYNLTPQSGHYRCLNCGKKIAHASSVYYIVVGTKPVPEYVRPANRGKLCHGLSTHEIVGPPKHFPLTCLP